MISNCGRIGRPNNGQHQVNGPIWEKPPVFGYDLQRDTIAAAWDGSSLSAAFPTLKYVTGYNVEVDIGLVGLVLVTSIINDQASPCSVFVVLDRQDTIDITTSSRVFLGTISNQNMASGGVPNPTNKSTTLTFGENSAIRINSGQRISVYASGSASTQLFTATLTVFSIHAAKNFIE